MKKMIYFAAFAIMMALGNMNAYAKVGSRNNAYHVNERGVVVSYHGDHHAMPVVHKMSKHERRMIEERRRMEERRRIEEARRIEEMRRMEAHHRHMAHHREVVVANNAVASVAAGVALVALIGAIAR